MLSFLVKTIPFIVSIAVFGYVILNVEYPKSLTAASAFQLILFFIPLFLSLVSLLNIFLNFILNSVIISLGIIILLILQALGALSVVTVGLTILAVYLFVSYFKKPKDKKISPAKGSNPIPPSLTSKINIPKLKALGGRKHE